MPANLENSSVDTELENSVKATGLEKVSFHSNLKERESQRMLKLPQTMGFISYVSKVMLKILQARLQQYMNCEIPDVQAGFRKAEEPEVKLLISAGSSKKQENSRKTSISVLLTMPKPMTVWVTANLENS